MSPMKKSLTALAATAMLATFGYAMAQTTDGTDPSLSTTQTTTTTSAPVTTTDANGAQTTTTTTTDTTNETLPAPPTGVVELAKPKNTVAPTDKQPNNIMGMPNQLMTTGVVDGITRPSIGDHATPPIPSEPEVVSVTTERTTSTTTTPTPAPAPEVAPAPAPAPEPAPAPMPAPRADRN